MTFKHLFLDHICQEYVVLQAYSRPQRFAGSVFLDISKNPENLKETKYERRGGANEILGTAAGTGMMDPSMAGPMTGV